jgi:NADPH-dependent 2,4-dienoyl-CoA reductase/sulfur reductase-like enzyme
MALFIRKWLRPQPTCLLRKILDQPPDARQRTAMHQPTTTARPSIYYRYQVFKPWLPSAHPAQERQQVVIAGSGPAGMVTALELARHGMASVIL